jgi:ORF6N domain
VILDTDLAKLYGVPTKTINQAVRRNTSRFRRLNELEKKYDSQFRVVFEAIRELMAEPEPKVKRIGFKT